MTDREPGGSAERSGLYAEFAVHLGDVSFPATRQDLVAAANGAQAPDWVLDLLANLDDVAPFGSAEEAWRQAAGPDGS